MKDFVMYLIDMLEDVERYHDLFFEVKMRLHGLIDSKGHKS